QISRRQTFASPDRVRWPTWLLEILAEQSFVQFLRLHVLFLGFEKRLSQRLEGLLELGIVAGLEPEVEHQRFELIAVLQVAQDGADLRLRRARTSESSR